MLNHIWFWMLIAGFVVGAINGRIDEITRAMADSAGEAVKLSVNLLGVLCLWTGLMNVAQKSGLVNAIARLAGPVMERLFPEIPKGHPAKGAIVMNFIANFLGLGNAATPLGIKAMNELQKINGRKDTASNSMCMFLVINAASLQLIPATIIALRVSAGSKNPTEIIGVIWICSLCACLAGIAAARLFSLGGYRRSYRLRRKRPGAKGEKKGISLSSHGGRGNWK